MRSANICWRAFRSRRACRRRFDVLDDQTARELRAEARTRVLERAGSGDAALADAAAHLVTHTSEWQVAA